METRHQTHGLCSELDPKSGLVCTEPEGHNGPHIASGTREQQLAMWEDSK